VVKRDLLRLRDLSAKEIEEIFALARALKRQQKRGVPHRRLAGKTLALVFDKPSLRTRVTFETAIAQLGGEAVFLGPQEIQLGVRETPADCARSLSCWVDLIVVRTFSQQVLEEMARAATVPVINGLTDLFHPCQVLADCFTLLEHRRDLAGLKIAFVGDGNNMVYSWMEATEKFPFAFRLACPEGYEPGAEFVRSVQENGGQVSVTHSVAEAVRGADILYTDVWASMGHEAEIEKRRQAFKGYQINAQVLGLAAKDALVMHCLPAHRGEEITTEVLDGPRSVVFAQAENRLHVQKAIMVWLLRKGLAGSKSSGRKTRRRGARPA
jgi:ornithine carbamoyltransferase